MTKSNFPRSTFTMTGDVAVIESFDEFVEEYYGFIHFRGYRQFAQWDKYGLCDLSFWHSIAPDPARSGHIGSHYFALPHHVQDEIMTEIALNRDDCACEIFIDEAHKYRRYYDWPVSCVFYIDNPFMMVLLIIVSIFCLVFILA